MSQQFELSPPLSATLPTPAAQTSARSTSISHSTVQYNPSETRQLVFSMSSFYPSDRSTSVPPCISLLLLIRKCCWQQSGPCFRDITIKFSQEKKKKHKKQPSSLSKGIPSLVLFGICRPVRRTGENSEEQIPARLRYFLSVEKIPR